MLPPGETAVMLLVKRSGEDITNLVFSAKLDYSVTAQIAHHSKYSACDSLIHCSGLLVTHSLCLIHRKSWIQCRDKLGSGAWWSEVEQEESSPAADIY